MVFVLVGNSYTDSGATATDQYNNTITVTTTNPVNTSLKGIYTVTYTATDTDGNISTLTRKVYVINVYQTFPGSTSFSRTLSSNNYISLINPALGLGYTGDTIYQDFYFKGNYSYTFGAKLKIVNNPSNFYQNIIYFSINDPVNNFIAKSYFSVFIGNNTSLGEFEATTFTQKYDIFERVFLFTTNTDYYCYVTYNLNTRMYTLILSTSKNINDNVYVLKGNSISMFGNSTIPSSQTTIVDTRLGLFPDDNRQGFDGSITDIRISKDLLDWNAVWNDSGFIKPINDKYILLYKGTPYTEYKAIANDSYGAPLSYTINPTTIDTNTPGTYTITYALTSNSS
ncbi:DUF5011 domain-containing protein, partial [bacterium]|nr:DUF5011 domain-containing protein [bacterium]